MIRLINRVIAYTCLFILCSCFTGAHDQLEKRVAVKLLKEDFNILRQTLEEAHPGLYWYTPKKEMNEYLDSIVRSIDQPLTKLEFMKLLLAPIANIHCGHTTIRFGREINPELLADRNLFPLGIAVLDGKVYVRENPVNPTETGFEIKSINAVLVKDIIQRMMSIIPADGFNKSFKYHLLGTVGFQEAYALMYGEPDEFIVDGVDSNENPIRLKLSPVSFNERFRESTVNNSLIDLRFLEDNTALVTIRSFIISRESFNSEISSVFERIRKNNSAQLIIDLRNNGGGNNGNVTELFSYLSDKPFYHLNKTEVTGKSLTHARHISNYQEISNMQSTRSHDGTYEVDYQYSGRRLKQPAALNAFAGKLIVLANGGTGSAASEFVALVHGNKRGLIVGEETGGCYYGATGGRYLRLALPNSGLEVTIPMVRIQTAVPIDFNKQPLGRGTLPDVPVILKPEDLGNHTDKFLDLSKELFTQNRF